MSLDEILANLFHEGTHHGGGGHPLAYENEFCGEIFWLTT